MTTMNNNTMIGKVLNSKVYDYAEGKAIFMNNEKVFLNSEIVSFLEKLADVDAEYEKNTKGIEIEIDDEIMLFEEKEYFENYDGRDHRVVEYDFDAMKAFVYKF